MIRTANPVTYKFSFLLEVQPLGSFLWLAGGYTVFTTGLKKCQVRFAGNPKFNVQFKPKLHFAMALLKIHEWGQLQQLEKHHGNCILV